MDLTVAVTGTGSELQGVGRAPDGRAVFVPGALPGETVSCRVLEEKERYLTARLLQVETASPRRRVPPCPYAGQCGGCSALHMDYEYSLALKREQLEQALRRIGGAEAPMVSPVLGAEEPFYNRNKAEYAIKGGRIGLRQAGSHEIIEILDCPAQHPLSIRAMQQVRKWLKNVPDFTGYLVTRVNGSGELMCILSGDRLPNTTGLPDVLPSLVSLYTCRLVSRPVHALHGDCTLAWGAEKLRDTLCGLSFDLHPQSFFQVNRTQAELLYDAALDMARLGDCEKVLDAYCGVGTITLYMARRCAYALGVEILEPAVRDAIANARRNGLSHKTKFHCADAAKLLPALLSGGGRVDAVVLDPPRKGVDQSLARTLLESGVPRIVYVSCDPATLARDIGRLRTMYHLEQVQPVDMFPWTGHVETVCLLAHN